MAPPSVTKFSEIKVGDKITARYYENIVLRVTQPGEKSVDTGTAGVSRSDAQKPGATAAAQRTITATITEIDPDGAVDHLHRPEQLEIQLASRRQAAANRLLGLTVGSYLDQRDDAVVLAVQLGALADGASYTAQTTLDAAAKNIRVVVQNSGHRPVAR